MVTLKLAAMPASVSPSCTVYGNSSQLVRVDSSAVKGAVEGGTGVGARGGGRRRFAGGGGVGGRGAGGAWGNGAPRARNQRDDHRPDQHEHGRGGDCHRAREAEGWAAG